MSVVKVTVLLVDDDQLILSSLKRLLMPLGVKLHCYSDPEKAWKFAEKSRPDLVISDERMPKLTGSDLLKKIHERWPKSLLILLSAHHDFDVVANAFNQHVINRYITKPWDDEELRFVVSKAVENVVNAAGKDVLPGGIINFHGMYSGDDVMKGVLESIRQSATANVPVFITGETGTGKELAAKACHQEGYHSDQPFIAVNCANFSENLMESQLFGHKKGAFTGATSDQAGLFAAAAKGTLFLDEVTTISLPLQAKLLRVIQEREFTPLGSHSIKRFDAKIISASSTRLHDAVVAGDFREDLYYRLNVIVINLPPLRERGDDACRIAISLLRVISEKEGKQFVSFSHAAEQLIRKCDWPGNVRQLENCLYSVIALNEGDEVSESMLKKQLANSGTLSRVISGSASLNKNSDQRDEIKPLWKVEKETIEHAIALCDGNVAKAAAFLEVSASTIYRKKQGWEGVDASHP